MGIGKASIGLYLSFKMRKYAQSMLAGRVPILVRILRTVQLLV